MRLYLEEMRSKIGLTAAEMNSRLYDISGIKIKCRSIETGHYWAEITPERAQILAEAYQTTAENILALESAEGKWEGRNYFGVSTQTYDTSVYDEALSSEEKDTAERLYDWLQRVITHMKFDRYASYTSDGIIAFADIEELGYIGFLRGIKALTKAKATDAEYISTLDEKAMSYYEKWYLRRKIYSTVQGEINKLTAQKRKSYTYAKRLDGGISGGADENDDSDLYELIPDRSLPVERYAESSWMLSMLYRHLNKHQIDICALLINGYDKGYLIRTKAASPTDIGVITFYLQQIIRYGKIRWEESDYVSGSANVRYDFRHNLWVVHMMYNGKHYSLGLYDDLNTALDVQVVANVLRASEEFVSWYERHMLYNVLTGDNAFTYPLPGDDEEYGELCGRDVRRIFKKQSSDDASYGVRFDKKCQRYVVTYGHDKLGRTKTLAEGLALRKLAEEKDRLGEYTEWLTAHRFKKHNPNRPNTTIRHDKRRKGYEVSRYCPEVQRNVYVGRYDTLEEAEKIRDEINTHLETGSFDEWHTEYKAKQGIVPKRDDGLVMTKVYQNRRRTPIKFEVTRWNNEKRHCDLVCSCDTQAEAERMSELANAHILVGDFEPWCADLKAKAKKDRYSAYAPAHIYKAYNQGSMYYTVSWANQYKSYNIANRKDKKEAEKILALANEHIQSGDIFEWMKAFKEEQRENRSITPARMRKQGALFSVSRYYRGKNLYIASFRDKGTAEKILALANEHIQAGDFDKWLSEYKAERKTEITDAAANTFARIHRSSGLYKVTRYQRGTEYYIASFADKAEAEKIQAVANEHINAGDFEEWRTQYRASRSYGSPKTTQNTVQWSYAMVDFAASDDGCYRVVCYDECDSTCVILSTQDVDRAYDIMNLANEHIEQGDYDAWFDEYKRKEADIYG